MATEYKSPLGLLDYIVPDRLEKQAISAFSRPLREGETAPDYGNFTPNIDPNNPTGLSNIETLLGNAYMPQIMNYGAGKGPTNKQMIDASILRAGLELGKGRLPGENFGAALNRGMEAFGAPAKTLSDYLVSQRGARSSGAMGDSSAWDNIRKDVELIVPDINTTLGIEDISVAHNMVRQYLNSVGRNAYSTGGMGNIDQAMSEHSRIILQYLQKGEGGLVTINPNYIDLAPEGMIKLKDNINKAIENEKGKKKKNKRYKDNSNETIP